MLVSIPSFSRRTHNNEDDSITERDGDLLSQGNQFETMSLIVASVVGFSHDLGVSLSLENA